ncbi:MAG: carboxypeptidase-like regulatory domain-containing protein [Pyrinomonadaceae bacterium]
MGAFELVPISSSSHTLSGRVTTSSGRAVFGSQLTLDDGAGNLRFARTSSFGYYTFSDIPAGNYTVTAASKRYNFKSRTIGLSSSVSDFDFVALQNP